MSKWSLLKSALVPSSSAVEEATSSSLSIHRFEGHQRIAKQKRLWLGFHLRVHVSVCPSVPLILNQCLDYFHCIDTTEFFLHLQSEQEDVLRSLSDELQATRSLPEQPEDTKQLALGLHQALSAIASGYWEAVFRVRHSSMVPVHHSLHFHQYALSCEEQSRTIWTREPPKKKKINIKELLSDRLYGVDNTGNVCVWPSEPLLLHLLLSEASLRTMVQGKRVIELGGGMTGLIGLGLASFNLCSELCITDGHPHCVLNQKSCLEMNTTMGSVEKNDNVRVELLEWSRYLQEDASLRSQCWDVVIGSDCLFFKDYHHALISVLDALLSPTGVAIFFQPTRSGTMELFLNKLPTDKFSTELVENYSQEIYEESLRLRKEDASYDVDVHYPLLLKITRKLSKC